MDPGGDPRDLIDEETTAVDVALLLVASQARRVRALEAELADARSQLDELITAARSAGATTVAIHDAGKMSRTTVHKALTHRSHRKDRS